MIGAAIFEYLPMPMYCGRGLLKLSLYHIVVVLKCGRMLNTIASLVCVTFRVSLLCPRLWQLWIG